MTLEQKTDQLIEQISEKTRLILLGQDISLEGLDEKVADTCEQIKELGGEKAREFEPKLKKMIINLDHLATAIKNSQTMMKQTLEKETTP